MSLALAIHRLIVDMDQLYVLYNQLHQVPPQVQDLFLLLSASRENLADIQRSIVRGDTNVNLRQDTKPIEDFRKRILDLEMFIDPSQSLCRSGPGSNTPQIVKWESTDSVNVTEFCVGFREHILKLDTDSSEQALGLWSENPAQISKSDVEYSASSTQEADYLKQSLDENEWNAFKILLDDKPSSVSDPAPNYNASTGFKSQGGFDSPRMHQAWGPSVIPVPPSQLVRSLPTLIQSPDIQKKRRKKAAGHLKTKADKRIEQILEQYNKPVAGVKRKHSERQGQNSPSASYVSHKEKMSPNDPYPDQSGEGVPIEPPSPRLVPRKGSGEDPAWSLDDLHDALPPSIDPYTDTKSDPSTSSTPLAPPRQPPNGGKQIGYHLMESVQPWDSSGSSYSGSSANSIISSAREGSIISTASKDRAYEEGACKIWYQQGPTLQELKIVHIEIRRQDRVSGEGTLIVSRTSSGQEIVDDLWMTGHGANSSPFLENSDIVSAFRHRDSSIKYVVRFAPNAPIHPRYSFTTKEECWDFMQSIVSKTLCASVDVESIKSACTHGNSTESGCETIQIWESYDTPSTRTVKLFRNKNSSAMHVIEFDSHCLRVPERGNKPGKLIFPFRDAPDGPTRDMKYLKISFSNDAGREDFLRETGLLSP